MTPDQFRLSGHALVEWVAAYRERMAELPVRSRVAPGEVRAAFPAEAPERGAPLETLLPLLDGPVLDGISHWNHPRFFAYFPSNTDLASVLADLVASGLGAQGMSWQTSPAATEVEEVMVQWLRRLTGLPERFEGVIHDTASTATLTALLCARERASDHAQVRGGMQGGGAPLTVYASAEAHSSIEKAALLAGFGRAHLRLIPVDGARAMRPEALAAAIEADVAAGLRPCAVVATAGSTATTAFDPLEAIAEVTTRHRLWLHVDAAMAGTAMVLPELRFRFAGIERADSLVFNPHKWMGTGFDLSAFFTTDAQHLVRVMSTSPSYLRTGHDGEVRNLRDWGIPLGRRFRALKLWFVLHTEGAEGLRARLRRDLGFAQRFAAHLERGGPGWQRVAEVTLQTVVFRHVPAGLSGPELDAHQQSLAEALAQSGAAWLTPTRLVDGWALRASFGSQGSTEADVDALWEALQAEAG